ncbi:MAG: sulfotransferase [Thermodesulfobacteriota bacterium]|nr:sulfotransferase [Thermodesulfobacteriota bacterium]
MSSVDSNSDPIFILGAMQRSGTNFLHDLICLHPDCCAGGVIWEDYLVHHSNLLTRYADSVFKYWNPRWEVDKRIGPPDLLCRCLGDSLISFLNLQLSAKSSGQEGTADRGPETSQNPTSKRLVTKTPSVNNIRHFFKIFPRCHLIIIIRDGRSVVESGVKSFNWEYERGMQRWAHAACTICEFKRAMRDYQHQYLIVRYEDLVGNAKRELTKILSFLRLDVKRYDFDSSVQLPVKGSSDVMTQGAENMHWQPVEKTSAFNPLNRWAHWTADLHDRFNWVAGKYLAEFGYAKEIQPINPFASVIKNVVLDIRWEFKRVIKALQRKLLHKLTHD